MQNWRILLVLSIVFLPLFSKGESYGDAFSIGERKTGQGPNRRPLTTTRVSNFWNLKILSAILRTRGLSEGIPTEEASSYRARHSKRSSALLDILEAPEVSESHPNAALELNQMLWGHSSTQDLALLLDKLLNAPTVPRRVSILRSSPILSGAKKEDTRSSKGNIGKEEAYVEEQNMTKLVLDEVREKQASNPQADQVIANQRAEQQTIGSSQQSHNTEQIQNQTQNSSLNEPKLNLGKVMNNHKHKIGRGNSLYHPDGTPSSTHRPPKDANSMRYGTPWTFPDEVFLGNLGSNQLPDSDKYVNIEDANQMPDNSATDFLSQTPAYSGEPGLRNVPQNISAATALVGPGNLASPVVLPENNEGESPEDTEKISPRFSNIGSDSPGTEGHGDNSQAIIDPETKYQTLNLSQEGKPPTIIDTRGDATLHLPASSLSDFSSKFLALPTDYVGSEQGLYSQSNLLQAIRVSTILPHANNGRPSRRTSSYGPIKAGPGRKYLVAPPLIFEVANSNYIAPSVAQKPSSQSSQPSSQVTQSKTRPQQGTQPIRDHSLQSVQQEPAQNQSQKMDSSNPQTVLQTNNQELQGDSSNHPPARYGAPTSAFQSSLRDETMYGQPIMQNRNDEISEETPDGYQNSIGYAQNAANGQGVIPTGDEFSNQWTPITNTPVQNIVVRLKENSRLLLSPGFGLENIDGYTAPQGGPEQSEQRYSGYSTMFPQNGGSEFSIPTSQNSVPWSDAPENILGNPTNDVRDPQSFSSANADIGGNEAAFQNPRLYPGYSNEPSSPYPGVQNQQPQGTYGAPQNQQPQGTDGAPQNQQPQETYGAPQNQQPQGTYGAPQNQQPQGTYGAPQNQFNGFGTQYTQAEQQGYNNQYLQNGPGIQQSFSQPQGFRTPQGPAPNNYAQYQYEAQQQQGYENQAQFPSQNVFGDQQGQIQQQDYRPQTQEAPVNNGYGNYQTQFQEQAYSNQYQAPGSSGAYGVPAGPNFPPATQAAYNPPFETSPSQFPQQTYGVPPSFNFQPGASGGSYQESSFSNGNGNDYSGQTTGVADTGFGGGGHEQADPESFKSPLSGSIGAFIRFGNGGEGGGGSSSGGGQGSAKIRMILANLANGLARKIRQNGERFGQLAHQVRKTLSRRIVGHIRIVGPGPWE